MTELIVALDGPNQVRRLRLLQSLPARWFKLGPQAMLDAHWSLLIRECCDYGRYLFLDLKLCDTDYTVRESVKRFAEVGISAVSTFTVRATETAVSAARGTPLKIWHTQTLTDDPDLETNEYGICYGSTMLWLKRWMQDNASRPHGSIGPPRLVAAHVRGIVDDVVCPAIRLRGEDEGGHQGIVFADDCSRRGITHAVVGRPIWSLSLEKAVVKCREYQLALQPSEE